MAKKTGRKSAVGGIWGKIGETREAFLDVAGIAATVEDARVVAVTVIVALLPVAVITVIDAVDRLWSSLQSLRS